jgi:hypothetical protein
MKFNPLKLSVLALGVSIIVQSCTAPTYVQSAPPPPPVYTQAPPPPPATYVEQPAPQQAYAQPQEAPPPPVSYQSFYNELSPYGQWINTPDYGYVWIPSAGPDFQPYASCGHWVLTNYGWTWVSDYSWGWAAFHYGSWDFDGNMGWFWIPGYQWSPAWVSWRSSPGYYGWAPLGPTYTSAGYATYNCPQQNYVFVSATYMNSPNVATYYQPRAQNATYYSNSAIITNTYYDRGSNNTYYAGPPSTEVERYTGSPVRQVALVQASSPERASTSGNQLVMFRPSVRQPSNNDAARPAPERVYQKTDVTPVAQRAVLTRPNQPRVAPFKPENTQHTSDTPPNQQTRQQQPAEQQHQPLQEQPQHPATQQEAAPAPQHVQQPQVAPVQQQHSAPPQQQPARQQQQKPKQGKQQKSKQQPKQQQPQQGQTQGRQQ